MHDEGPSVFSLIRDIDSLWKDVYPYLARHIAEIYSRKDGAVAEMGPFCGVIYELARQGIGDSFFIASFPKEMTAYYTQEIDAQGRSGSITVMGTDPRLSGLDNNSIDLLIFRGALFFPSLFTVDYHAIDRVLKPAGCAFVGGGFGKYTPPDIILPIANRSRELNLLIGKKEVTMDMIARDLRENGLTDRTTVTTEGGMWIIIRKENP
jgi:hypothetical protein